MTTSTAVAPSPATPTRQQKSLPDSPKTPSRDVRDPVKRRSLQGTPIRHLADLANLAVIVRRLSPRSGGELIVACDSGPESQTHASIKDAQNTATAETRVTQTEHFICSDAVDLVILLRATRSSLLERVRKIGGNALMNESWTSKIRGPRNNVYRVHIEYSASPARCLDVCDPGRPVALDNVRSVPGMMSILERL